MVGKKFTAMKKIIQYTVFNAENTVALKFVGRFSTIIVQGNPYDAIDAVEPKMQKLINVIKEDTVERI